MKLKKSALALSVLLSSTAIALPATASIEGLSANASMTSNYLWRGISQTDDGAAVQGGIDYEHDSGFYVGTWASNVDFSDSASYELDFYLGFSGDITDTGVGYDVGYIYYAYPDSDELGEQLVGGELILNEYDFGEIYGSLSYSYFSFTASYGVHSDDGGEVFEDALYLSLDGAFEVSEGLELGLHIGDYSFDDDYDSEDYNDYSVSLSKDNFTLMVVDTDRDQDDVKVVISYAIDIDL